MNQEQQIRLSRIKKLALLLDAKFEVPGGFRFGLDALLGLIPVLGDVITVGFSLYILFQSWMMQVPNWVLARMLLNILIETLVDMIPVLGNIFDFFWKANQKNVEILNNYFHLPQKVVAKSKFQLLGLTSIIFVSVMLGCMVGLGLLYYLFHLIFP